MISEMQMMFCIQGNFFSIHLRIHLIVHNMHKTEKSVGHTIDVV